MLGLLNNESTNQCENKFSIRQSMLPKCMSTTRGGAFSTAVKLSNLRVSKGPDYILPLYRRCTSKEPAPHLQNTIKSVKRKATYSKEYQEKPETKKRRQYLKQRKSMVRTKCKYKVYGDREPDLSKEDLIQKVGDLKETLASNIRSATKEDQKKATTFLDKVKAEFGDAACHELEVIIGSGSATKKTVFINQRESCDEWLSIRDDMVTASNFHNVLTKRKDTDCRELIRNIVKPRDISNLVAVKYGITHEKVAIEKLQTKMPDLFLKHDLGLWQHEKYPWLGATPDGLIYNKNKPVNQQWGTLEVKCPFHCRDTTPDNAKNVFDKKTGKIKKSHSYYTQIQGQMACVGVSWGIMVIWSPHGIYVEEILYDATQWDKSLKKLDCFWSNAFMLERVDSRSQKQQPVRSWCFQDEDKWLAA
jgi:hypothetical protein